MLIGRPVSPVRGFLLPLPPAVTPNEEYILELFQDAGLLITGTQVFEGARTRLGAWRQRRRCADRARLSDGGRRDESAVAAASNMEFVDLSQILVKPEIIDLIPRDKAYRYKACPSRSTTTCSSSPSATR